MDEALARLRKRGTENRKKQQNQDARVDRIMDTELWIVQTKKML